MGNSLSFQDSSEVVFYDDFRSAQLDPSRWNIKISGPTVNNEQQAYLQSSQTICVREAEDGDDLHSGGVLALQAHHQPGFLTSTGEELDFLSGRIDTREKFEFQHGTAAARMKLPRGSGLWPAFWLMGRGPWPETGEIDIMESVGEPDWVSAGAHGPGYAGESGLINQAYLVPPDDITHWHIYSVDWQPNQFLFRIDGKLIFRVTSAMVQFFGPWVFDNPKYLIINLAVGGKYPHKINGVTVPYYGLPQATLQAIQENPAQLLVDWVKVTKHV